MAHLEIGGIYSTQWDERPYRIIGFDEVEVFYDCRNLHDNSWTFSGNFKKKCYFFRISRAFFSANAKQHAHQPLSVEETKFFRPDLPMRIGRFKELCWNAFEQKNIQALRAYLEASVESEVLHQSMQSQEIIVLPYGQKGGLLKGEKLTADNQEFFTLDELVWKSKLVQEAVNANPSSGIGLYRMGFEKGLPSYYIGEYVDRAGLFQE